MSSRHETIRVRGRARVRVRVRVRSVVRLLTAVTAVVPCSDSNSDGTGCTG